jgi:hypothetical protein
VAIQRVKQPGIAARELVGLAQVVTSALEGLFADDGAPVAFHRCVMRGDELGRDHAFDFVVRPVKRSRRV